MINIETLRLQMPASLAAKGPRVGQWVDHYLSAYLNQAGVHENQNIAQITLGSMQVAHNATEQQIGQQIAGQLAKQLEI